MRENEQSGAGEATRVDRTERVEDAMTRDAGQDAASPNAGSEALTRTARSHPSSSSTKSERPSGSHVGRFRLDAPLGAGGMGEVYRAYDPMLDRKIALKVLHAPSQQEAGASDSDARRDAQRMRRVLHEARAAAAMTHPNTVTIFEVGEAGDDVFIAMELLEGEDLRSVMERGATTPTTTKLRWLLEAARALAAAHERGLVHRDVKPENMFICKGSETLKLLDFGIAKRDHERTSLTGGEDPADSLRAGPTSLRTQEGYLVGTPRYMAPEQRFGHATDARTDEYAWGLVACELLTGMHPEDATPASDALTAGKEMGAVVRPLSSVRVTELAAIVGDEVAAVIAHALEPLKEERFASMAEVAVALEKAIATSAIPGAKSEDDSEPVSDPRVVTDAPKATAPEPAIASPFASDKREPPKSRRLAIAAMIAALVVVGAFGLWRQRQSRRSAESPDARLTTLHTLKLQADDRMTVLPDGTIIVARDVSRDLRLDAVVQDADGAETSVFLQSTYLTALKGFQQLTLRSASYQGAPAVVTMMTMENGLFVGAWTQDKGFGTQRVLSKTLSGTSLTNFGRDIVLLTTDGELPWQQVGYVTGTNVYALSPSYGGQRYVPIEQGIAAHSPTVAATEDRLAVGYTLNPPRTGMRFALYDPSYTRLGDTLSLPTGLAAGAIAFAGQEPVVFWATDVGGGKVRLVASKLRLGASAFTSPELAIDEAVAAEPAAAKLPDGRWIVLWMRGVGGVITLRAALLLPDGRLGKPITIGESPSKVFLHDTTTTTRGLVVMWGENAETVHVTQLTWASPSPSPSSSSSSSP